MVAKRHNAFFADAVAARRAVLQPSAQTAETRAATPGIVSPDLEVGEVVLMDLYRGIFTIEPFKTAEEVLLHYID